MYVLVVIHRSYYQIIEYRSSFKTRCVSLCYLYLKLLKNSFGTCVCIPVYLEFAHITRYSLYTKGTCLLTLN